MIRKQIGHATAEWNSKCWTSDMKKLIFVIVIWCGICSLHAQPSYKELNARLPQLAPHEALYWLGDYQSFFPSQPHPYYQMGSISYKLIIGENPLLDYNELKLCLYNTKLYYGNCLHFAENQSIKTEYYPGVPYRGNKLTYEELQSFLSARIDTVNSITQRVDALYSGFYNLVEQYNRCVALYTQFVSQYDCQKNAAFLLTEEDNTLLADLQQKADSLPGLIETFQTALKDYPIDAYSPSITFRSIELYRLDGLTAADFLQNKVVLWDYAEWVRNFSKNRQENIERLRTDINSCQQLLLEDLEAAQDLAIPVRPLRTSEDISVLLNRIDRFDYESFLVPLLTSEQLCLATSRMARKPLFARDSTMVADTLAVALQALFRMRDNKKNMVALNKSVRQRLTSVERRKHAAFLQRFYSDNSLFIRLEYLFAHTDSLLQYASQNTAVNARHLTTQQSASAKPALPKKWRVPAKATEQLRLKNDLTSEFLVAYATPSEEAGNLISIVRLSPEGTELTRLELRAEAQVKNIIQMDEQWLALLDWQQYTDRRAAHGSAVMSVLFNRDGKVTHISFYSGNQPEKTVAVCKLTSNLIALVTETADSSVIRFLDAQGEER